MSDEKAIYKTKYREKNPGKGSHMDKQLSKLEIKKENAKKAMISKLCGLCLKGGLFSIELQLDFLKVKKQANLPTEILDQDELIECYETAVKDARLALEME